MIIIILISIIVIIIKYHHHHYCHQRSISMNFCILITNFQVGETCRSKNSFVQAMAGKRSPRGFLAGVSKHFSLRKGAPQASLSRPSLRIASRYIVTFHQSHIGDVFDLPIQLKGDDYYKDRLF